MEVFFPQTPGVEIPQELFHLIGGHDFAHHVKYGLAMQGVPDFIESIHQPLQHPALHRVPGKEVEDQAIMLLPIAVDAAHALFQAVGVPGNVVVKEDITAVQVDAFPGGLGGGQYLGLQVPKLALSMESGAGFVPPSRFHTTMDETHG